MAAVEESKVMLAPLGKVCINMQILPNAQSPQARWIDVAGYVQPVVWQIDIVKVCVIFRNLSYLR